jgi:GR25 family glycosyltransferase involved in LPS biosynthesis
MKLKFPALVLLLLLAFLVWFACCRNEAFVDFTEEPYDVYLINLDRHTDRLSHFEAQIVASDLSSKSFTRVAAVNGKDLDIQTLVTPKAFQEIEESTRNRYRKKHYELTPGAIGCALSHLKVYDMIKESDKEMALIFEDDAIIHKSIDLEFRKCLKDIPADWDMILLGYFCNQCKYSKKYNRVTKFFGNHAYVINRKGIDKIQRYYGAPIDRQIDAAMSNMAEEGRLNIYATPVKYAKQSNQFGTSIQIPLKRMRGVDPFDKE